ncbi:MAG TPA: sigma-70 family RNA polymerase sigma factor [Gemmataceae bacterium]|nr:sigma-70 family RNA polymerase sigma factor [Gemmataceae bacterium]
MSAHASEDSSIGIWLAQARTGSGEALEALGAVLESCRNYLLLVANQSLNGDLRGKIAPSDLVQETFLEAQRDFERFQGTSEKELLAWLRRILVNNIANAVRQYKDTDMRDVRREVRITSTSVGALADGAATPGSAALTRERDDALHEALGKLPASTRDVVCWRNYELCSFEEIGLRLGGTAEGARKVWARALVQLQKLLESSHESESG